MSRPRTNDAARWTLAKRVFWYASWYATRALLALGYRIRSHGSGHVPRSGPALLVANHQSYLDPPAMGHAIPHRRIDFVARVGLHAAPMLGLAIRILNTIPIRENSGDSGAIKDVLRRLEAGHVVLIFPEGTRSPDGRMVELKRGVSLLIRRARCPVIPVAIEGAFDAWPRTRKLPGRFGCALSIGIGPAIAGLESADADEALDRVSRAIDALRLERRGEIRRRTRGRFPPPGPADFPSYPATPASPTPPDASPRADGSRTA